MDKAKFSIGGKIESWTLVEFKEAGMNAFSDLAHKQDTVKGFVMFMQAAGINIPQTPRPEVDKFTLHTGNNAEKKNEETIEKYLKSLEIRGPHKPKFLVVLLPYNDGHIYSTVKRIADTEVGIHTVCVVASKFSQATFSYFGNVALKFNLKAGGVNQTLVSPKLGIINEGKTMVVGIDVNPPKTQTKTNPTLTSIKSNRT
jgi:hypothetical protein